ncbi:MAG: rhodanese-like domain-containing protein [Bacillaceae bacterium]|nr:rhodanese-like domain-containing protein [Bacillaceae bacterium]
MNKKFIVYFIFVILVVILIGATFLSNDKMDNTNKDLSITWEEMSSDEVMKQIGNEELQFVDLREEELYNEGHVPGAINIPYEDFQQRFTELRKDKGVILICHTGRMGEESADFLLTEGFTDVANFGGGMAVWDGPLETE